MSPVNHHIKISLTHKNKKSYKKAMVDTNAQETPQSASLPASLTVEASLAFPLMLFVILFFLSFFRVMQVQQMTAEALALSGTIASLEVEGNNAVSGEGGKGYAGIIAGFQAELLKQKCPVKYVEGGNLGFSFHGTSMAGDYIELHLSYKIGLPGGILDGIRLPVTQHLRLKKWTGYHGAENGQEADSWVYVTKESNVFHLTPECTHLSLSIRSLAPTAAEKNHYTACMICGTNSLILGCYYVTDEGDRYHTRLNCSGLKRTVYMIRRSETAGRNCCRRCSGN